MGAFDDLIPQQSASGGTFDDLIPQAPRKPIGAPEELSFAEKAADWFNKVTGGAVEAVAPYARGFVQGAADPVVGAAQLGANLVGQGEGINRAIAEQEAKSKMLGTSEGARIAGTIASPVNLAAAGVPVFSGAATTAGRVAQLGKNIGVGAGTGAAFGAAETVKDPTQDYWDQKLDQIGAGAAIGGAVGGVAAPIVKGIGLGTGVLFDAVRGRLPQLQAAKAVRSVLPDEAAARAALQAAPSDVTAAQALYDAGLSGPTIAALGERARAVLPDAYEQIARQQAAARMSGMQAVTPDLAAAEAAREAAAGVAYGRAYASDAQRRAVEDAAAEAAALSQSGGIAGYGTKAAIPPQLAALLDNPVIASAAREAQVLAKTKGLPITDPMGSLEGLHLMKLAIDNQFKNRSASTALQNYSDDALRDTKARLLAAIEGTTNQPGISPLYGVARQQFAAMSPEVNQAQVMRELVTTLQKPGIETGERAAQFLSQTEPRGAGVLSMLKRADQSPRMVGEIGDVLTPAQMASVSKVRSELSRDQNLLKEAVKGKESATKALQDVNLTARLPSFFDKWVTFINKGLATTEDRVNEATLKALSEGMQSGQSLNKLLMMLPTYERNKVLRGMVKAEKAIPYAAGVAVGASQ